MPIPEPVNFQDSIQQAIGAHGMWKQRLRAAVATGNCDVPVSAVCRDDHCVFGEWLYSQDRDVQASPRWRCVRNAHADFHREAGRILALAVAGKKREAEAALAPAGNFDALSATLTHQLMMWKREAAPVQARVA